VTAGLAPMEVVRRVRDDAPAMHGDGRLRWDVSPGTLQFLADNVQARHRTLEVGCGVSSVVFAATGARHTAMSPAPDEYAHIIAYCAEIGVDTSRLQYLEGLSHDVLPRLQETVDVALIDGAHSFPYPVVDYHYVSRLLRPGGLLVLDDVPIPAVGVLFRFLSTEPAWQLLEILDDRAAAFRLMHPLDAGDPWGSQPINSAYPDYSFLAPARRARVRTAETLARSRVVTRARRRFPRLNAVSPTVRRWLT
jgi:SAM-dependent methyltransferase